MKLRNKYGVIKDKRAYIIDTINDKVVRFSATLLAIMIVHIEGYHIYTAVCSWRINVFIPIPTERADGGCHVGIRYW